MNEVVVSALSKRFKQFEKDIKSTAFKALGILNQRNSVLEVYLVGSEKIRWLNKEFRGRDKPACVLSFKEPKNFPHPELNSKTRRKIKYLGEIYIKFPVTNNYSSAQLLVHGLLHLLNYNHKRKNDRIKMEKKEQWLIGKLVN